MNSGNIPALPDPAGCGWRWPGGLEARTEGPLAEGTLYLELEPLVFSALCFAETLSSRGRFVWPRWAS